MEGTDTAVVQQQFYTNPERVEFYVDRKPLTTKCVPPNHARKRKSVLEPAREFSALRRKVAKISNLANREPHRSLQSARNSKRFATLQSPSSELGDNSRNDRLIKQEHQDQEESSNVNKVPTVASPALNERELPYAQRRSYRMVTAENSIRKSSQEEGVGTRIRSSSLVTSIKPQSTPTRTSVQIRKKLAELSALFPSKPKRHSNTSEAHMCSRLAESPSNFLVLSLKTYFNLQPC